MLVLPRLASELHAYGETMLWRVTSNVFFLMLCIGGSRGLAK